VRRTLRSLNAETHNRAIDHILKVTSSLATLTDTQIDARFFNGPPSVNNDPELTELIRHSATDLLGKTHVPGSLFRLGCAPSQKNAPPLHAADFDIDERALTIGAKILARSVVQWFDPSHKAPGRSR